MKVSVVVAVVVTAFAVVGGVPSSAQYGGTPSAQAQQAPDGAVPQPQGLTTKNLVTSLGGFRATANVPIVLTGQVVTIEPGGQTGRQRHLVPSYVYVLEGVLTTNTQGGPPGVDGAQYHAAGQSYADPGGLWHNYSNGGTAPVRYLLLFIGTPGGPTTQKAEAD